MAFLRGINVGGHTKVEMGRLRETLEGLGYKEVKTILNSGNVVFEAGEKDLEGLTKKIGEKLQEVFGFKISVILRRMEQIKALIKSDPFKDIKITPQTRLLVTFLPKGELFNSIEAIPGKGTPELMAKLEKEHGKNITTRIWGTVTKLAKLG